MKKRWIVTVITTAVVLSGCGKIPDLDDINRDMEAEYMAGALLKYDKNNDDILDYDRSILRATPTPIPTRKPAAVTQAPSVSGSPDEQGNAGGADAADNVPAQEVFNLKQVDIKMMSAERKDTYGSADAAISAHDGRTLYIVHFRIRNQAASGQKVNLMKKQLQYRLEADGEIVGAPLMTILKNDLQYYRERMASGRSSEAVLVFEVDKKQKLQNGSIQVSDGNKTGRICVN